MQATKQPPLPFNTLPFTTISNSGEAREIDFPLHPETLSPDQVGVLVSTLLQALTEQINKLGTVGNGDVMQALAMVAAIRTQMVDVDTETTHPLMHELLEQALQASQNARMIQAGRA